MVKILLVSHGKLAVGLNDAVRMLLGNVSDLESISFDDSMGIDGLKEELERHIEGLDKPLLIFTDLKGGTPFNIVSLLSKDHENIKNIYGMNLPMVLESVLLRQDLSLNDLVDSVISIKDEAIGLSVI